MSGSQKKCLAILKNGSPCSYRGRPEFNGYCGIHRVNAIDKVVTTGDQRDRRLLEILAAGVALMEITAKATEYSPGLIEILVNASNVAFCEMDSGEVSTNHTFEGAGYMPEGAGAVPPSAEDDSVRIPFQCSPSALPGDLARVIERRDWQALANMLAYDFDVQIYSGNLPASLRARIDSKKQAVVAALEALGVKPGLHTIHRPVFSRTLVD